MATGKYEKSTNTFVMDAGAFPNWWAPVLPTRATCQRVSSMYLTCGCIHSPVIHTELCGHHQGTATNYLAPVERFRACENTELIWAVQDLECNNCLAFRQLYPMTPQPQPNWQNIVPMIQPLTMQMIYEREIALQGAKAEEAAKAIARHRHSEIMAAWENRVLRILDMGLLDQQPNVRATEDGMVYDLRILHQSCGDLKIMTCCENEDTSKRRAKMILRAELVVEFIPDGGSEAEKITTAKMNPATHDKTKCMVCLSHPGWCISSTSETETAPPPVTANLVYEGKLKNASVDVGKPVWRDWGLLHGIY